MTRFLACVALGLACVSVWAQEAAPPPLDRTAETTPIPAEAYPTATSIRLAGDEKQTRVVLDFTRKIDMRAFTLADPYRLIIDLPQVNFQLPARTGEAGRGLVKAFRFGLLMKGGSRVVLDLTAPAKVEKSFVLDPVDDQPARLVLDLVGVDRDAFLRAIAFDKHGGPTQEAARKPDRDPAAPTDDPRPLIVLDPGHGGIDEGAHARSGEAEKTVVLDFALLLRDKIERLGKYRVEMTRTEDTFVALADRVQF